MQGFEKLIFKMKGGVVYTTFVMDKTETTYLPKCKELVVLVNATNDII